MQVLAAYLQNSDYDKRSAEFLIRGFVEGFKINYTGPRVATKCSNLKSARENELQIVEKVFKEIHAGRVAGPFRSRPFPNLRLSPIGLVPKKDGSFRLIHHLSFPANSSVNSFIDKSFCSVNYSSLDDAVNLLSLLGTGALMGKIDLKSAFRLLPIHPSDFELLGFRLNDMFFFDKCLPMGCSVSCSLFEEFSTCLEWLLRKHSGQESVVHYLDDFLFAGKAGDNACNELMLTFVELCRQLGVPLADDKTVWPTTSLIFLGFELDSVEMKIKIPVDKLYSLKDLIICFLARKKATLKEFQALAGLLNFCLRAIPPARAFTRRIYDVMQGVVKPHHLIRVSVAVKDDLRVWLTFLDLFNGCYYFPQIDWVDDEHLQLFTDSAGNLDLGCGAFFRNHWLFFKWPTEWAGTEAMRDITFLELVPIVLAIHAWGNQLTSKKIVFRVDNEALVAILNKKSSKSKRVMGLIRPLVLQSMLSAIQFKACHILGVHNEVADALSRCQFQRFRTLVPQADLEPTPIPDSFLTIISRLSLTD